MIRNSVARSLAVWIAALVLIAQRSHSQCFLQDASATCPVCFITSSGRYYHIEECPTGAISMSWDLMLPTFMEAKRSYHTKFTFSINMTALPVQPKLVNGVSWQVPHVNIHSCLTSRGACTPFVSSTPGLATHTPELRSNLTSGDGRIFSMTHSSDVALPADHYTIIAHVEVFIAEANQTSNQQCYPRCMSRYHVVLGIQREVVPVRMQTTSTSAYISTGIAGLAMLMLFGAIMWASKKGCLDIDGLIHVISSEWLMLITSIAFDIGENVAYTLSVPEMMKDRKLQNFIPAAYVILCTSWTAGLYAGYSCLARLLEIAEQNYKPERFRVKRLARQSRLITGRRVTVNNVNSEEMQILVDEYEVARRSMKQLYADIITIIFENLPVAAICTYAVAVGDGISVVELVAAITSSVLLGTKVHGLSYFRQVHKRLQVTSADLFGGEAQQSKLTESSEVTSMDSTAPRASEALPEGIGVFHL